MQSAQSLLTKSHRMCTRSRGSHPTDMSPPSDSLHRSTPVLPKKNHSSSSSPKPPNHHTPHIQFSLFLRPAPPLRSPGRSTEVQPSTSGASAPPVPSARARSGEPMGGSLTGVEWSDLERHNGSRCGMMTGWVGGMTGHPLISKSLYCP